MVKYKDFVNATTEQTVLTGAEKIGLVDTDGSGVTEHVTLDTIETTLGASFQAANDGRYIPVGDVVEGVVDVSDPAVAALVGDDESDVAANLETRFGGRFGQRSVLPPARVASRGLAPRTVSIGAPELVAAGGSPTAPTLPFGGWMLPDDATSKVGALFPAVSDRVEIEITYRSTFDTVQGLTVNQQGLETDVSGWVAGSGGAVSRVTSDFRSGIASLKLSRGAGGTGNARCITTTGTGAVPTLPGNVCTGTSWVKADANGNGVELRLGLAFYDVAGTQVGSFDQAPAATTYATTSWQKLTWSATAPAGAVFVALTLNATSLPNPASIFLDDNLLDPGVTTAQYFVIKPFTMDRSDNSTATALTEVSGRETTLLASPTIRKDVIRSAVPGRAQFVAIQRIPLATEDTLAGDVEILDITVRPSRVRISVPDTGTALGLGGGLVELPNGRTLAIYREGVDTAGQQVGEDGGYAVLRAVYLDDSGVKVGDSWVIADPIEMDADVTVVDFRSGDAFLSDGGDVIVLVERASHDLRTKGMGKIVCDWRNVENAVDWSFSTIPATELFRFWFTVHRWTDQAESGAWIAFGQQRNTENSGDNPFAVMYSTDDGGTWEFAFDLIDEDWQGNPTAEAGVGKSEPTFCCIGQNRWIGLIRVNDGGPGKNALLIRTDDPLDSASYTVVDSLIPLGGNPSAVIYDAERRRVVFLGWMRANETPGVIHSIGAVVADAETLWSSGASAWRRKSWRSIAWPDGRLTAGGYWNPKRTESGLIRGLYSGHCINVGPFFHTSLDLLEFDPADIAT